MWNQEFSPASTRSRTLRSLHSDFEDLENFDSSPLFRQGCKESMSASKFNLSADQLTMATTLLVKKLSSSQKNLLNPESLSIFDPELKFPSFDKQTTVN